MRENLLMLKCIRRTFFINKKNVKIMIDKRKVEDLEYDFVSDSYTATSHLKEIWWKKRVPILAITLIGSLVLGKTIVG